MGNYNLDSDPERKPPSTPRLKKVIKLAYEFSNEKGSNYLGPDHFLVAIVREGGSDAAKGLAKLGVTKDNVEKLVDL